MGQGPQGGIYRRLTKRASQPSGNGPLPVSLFFSTKLPTMVHQPDMSKPNALAFEDVVLEKPEKPLVVSGQLVSHDLTEDDLLFLESFSPKEQNRIFHKV